MRAELACRLQMLCQRLSDAWRERRERRRGRWWITGHEVLKGTADRVIVIRDPVPGLFREAVFLLREDYGEGLDRQELLLEARDAAFSYTASHLPARRPRSLWPYLLTAGASAGLTWLALRL